MKLLSLTGLFTVVLLFFSGSLAAQQAALSTGGDISGPEGKMSYSIGQSTYTEFSENTFSLSFGVQQSFRSCLGDFNNDGIIATADLLIFLIQYGCITDCFADFDNNGSVATSDLLFFLTVFGTVCP